MRDRLLDLYASGCVQLPSSVLLMHRTKCAPSSTSSLPWLTQAVTTLLRTPYSSAIAAVVYWIMFVAYGLALACYTVHTGGDYTKRRTRWGPPCSICGSIPFLAHHPVFAQAVRFLGILADAFKQCTAIGRKTTAKGGKGCHFWIRDTTRLSTFMGCGLE